MRLRGRGRLKRNMLSSGILDIVSGVHSFFASWKGSAAFTDPLMVIERDIDGATKEMYADAVNTDGVEYISEQAILDFVTEETPYLDSADGSYFISGSSSGVSSVTTQDGYTEGTINSSGGGHYMGGPGTLITNVSTKIVFEVWLSPDNTIQTGVRVWTGNGGDGVAIFNGLAKGEWVTIETTAVTPSTGNRLLVDFWNGSSFSYTGNGTDFMRIRNVAVYQVLPVYESDFSSGVDGFSTSNTTLSAPVSIGGEDDVLEVEASGGLSVHQAVKAMAFGTVGQGGAVKFKAYVPSKLDDGVTDSLIKRILVTGLTNSSISDFTITEFDTWVEYEVYGEIASTSLQISPYPAAGSSFDQDGAKMYLKDVDTFDAPLTILASSYNNQGSGSDALASPTTPLSPKVFENGSVYLDGDIVVTDGQGSVMRQNQNPIPSGEVFAVHRYAMTGSTQRNALHIQQDEDNIMAFGSGNQGSRKSVVFEDATVVSAKQSSSININTQTVAADHEDKKAIINGTEITDASAMIPRTYLGSGNGGYITKHAGGDAGNANNEIGGAIAIGLDMSDADKGTLASYVHKVYTEDDVDFDFT